MSAYPISAEIDRAIDMIKICEGKALENEALSWEEAVTLMELDLSNIYDLIASANRVRRRFKGDEISLCSIINAKSGHCPEDCAFCPQSVHAKTKAPVFGLVPEQTILDGALASRNNGASKYGIVTSGYGLSGNDRENDLEQITRAIELMKEKTTMGRCASLGVIDEPTARKLKSAGLEEYHHNLECARSFFPNICTTHDYDDDVNTVRAVKAVGLRACCGGVFGLGESVEQRVELAFTIRELDVDSIPLNFLNPIKGTRLENIEPPAPLEILKIIAVYRMIFPDKDIKVAGGREKNLRDLQCMMFSAGANSTMTGNYLTTYGRPAGEDMQMIRDLGLTVRNK